MCTRANVLLVVPLTAALFVTDDSGELSVKFSELPAESHAPKRVHPRPTTWREMDIASYEQPIADDRTVTLRLDPDLPETTAYTVERVVDGDPSRTIVYVPWVHEHPNAPPMPEAYLASLVEVLESLSASVILVGVEGSDVWEDLLYEEFLEVANTLERCDVLDPARSSAKITSLCDEIRALQTQLYAFGTERALSTFAMAATVPIVGVDDTAFIASELDDRMCDRLRSDAAVRNTLDALAARGGGRAVLLFGMAHHHDIEVAARRAGATLDLVCMPHLCRAMAP